MKRMLSIVALLLILVTFAGCSDAHTYMSWTFDVETGDDVKIRLETTDGYTISSDVPFVIKHNDEELSHRTFIKGDFCEQYREAAKTQEGSKVLTEGEIDGHKYIFWSFNDEEWNYCIELEGGKTGILLGNAVSRETAEEVFSRLKITIE